MNSTVRLPSGKLIDLSRFIALLKDSNSDGDSYRLSLDGLTEEIAIDGKDADFISKKLDLEPKTNSELVNACWDKELQLSKNKPLMSLIKQWQESKTGKTITEEETQEYRDIQQALKRNL